MHSLISLVKAFGCCGERYASPLKKEKMKEKGNKTSHPAEVCPKRDQRFAENYPVFDHLLNLF